MPYFEHAIHFIIKEKQLSNSEVAFHNFSTSCLTFKNSQAAEVSLKENKPVWVPNWWAGIIPTWLSFVLRLRAAHHLFRSREWMYRSNWACSPSPRPHLLMLRYEPRSEAECLPGEQEGRKRYRHILTPSLVFCKSEVVFLVSLPASPPSELLLFSSSLQSLSSSSPGDFRDCLEDF